MDTLGFLLAIIVHGADMQDRDGAKLLLKDIKRRFPRLKITWADGGYQGKLEDWAKEEAKIKLEIVRKMHPKEFNILPKRWIVERSFGWLVPARRMAKDYEGSDLAAVNFVTLRFLQILTTRIIKDN